jgi:hypothetical protein
MVRDFQVLIKANLINLLIKIGNFMIIILNQAYIYLLKLKLNYDLFRLIN